MKQRWAFRFAVVSFCLLGWHDSALAQDSASPRVTRTVEIIREIEGGVVAIFSQAGDRTLHSGSGSVIHPAGFILTNDHVVRDRPGVVLMKGRGPVRYQTVGRLPEKDLAVIRIVIPEELTVIPLGHSDDLMTGEKDGLYRLILASDDGSRLFLHDRLLIDNGGHHPRQEIGGKVRLGKGLHPVRIDYSEATGDSVLELYLEDAAGERVKLGEGAFFHEGKKSE